MSYFEFPHTRTYDSDLGWLIRAFKQLNVDVDNLQEWAAEHQPEYLELAEKVEGLINQLVDVIVPWNSSIAYPIYSIVEYQGTNYIAVQNVPVGAMITDTEYWQPANTVVEQINAIGQVVADMQADLRETTEGSTVHVHQSASVGDTSYILLKLDRSKYRMEFHNCSGNDSDGPNSATASPLAFLESHIDEYDLVTNCSYLNADFPGRLGGVENAGAAGWSTTMHLFCYNSESEEIYVSPIGALLPAVPSSYDVVFPIDVALVVDGQLQTVTATPMHEPRNCFGWDEDYFYVLFCEGRGTHERGLSRQECAVLMHAAGAVNAYNFDGGGSVCMAVNYNGDAVKVNKARDTTLAMPLLRNRSIAQCYRRR